VKSRFFPLSAADQSNEVDYNKLTRATDKLLTSNVVITVA
jgi:hypothetical protein